MHSAEKRFESHSFHLNYDLIDSPLLLGLSVRGAPAGWQVRAPATKSVMREKGIKRGRVHTGGGWEDEVFVLVAILAQGKFSDSHPPIPC